MARWALPGQGDAACFCDQLLAILLRRCVRRTTRRKRHVGLAMHKCLASLFVRTGS